MVQNGMMPLSGPRANFRGCPKYPSLKPLLINALNVLQYIRGNGQFDATINGNDNIN